MQSLQIRLWLLSLGWVLCTDGLCEEPIVHTVTGPIVAQQLGKSLTHEHVLVDFIGAEETGYHRWNREEVVESVLPYLLEVKQLGYQSLFECTPAYLGRDPKLLRQLSERSGMNLITNTGLYGARENKFLPSEALNATADELAQDWIDEFETGIENTGIKPGFIKIGVDGGEELSPLHDRLVRAACRTHLATGLTIASHTGPNVAAFRQLDIAKQEGVSAEAFIWVHATLAPPRDLIRAARLGAWVSLDNIRNATRLPDYIERIQALKDEGLLSRLLISHDAGWYRPGEPNGGDFVAFTFIARSLVPALRDAGFTEREIDQILVRNPATAFSTSVRRLR